MVKEFLSQKGVDFNEIDISRDPAGADELMSKTGRMAVPVTVIDGQTIVGFDRMRLEQLIGLAQVRDKRKPIFGALVADSGKGGGVVLGAYVGKVNPGSAAERIGLAAGDIITELNGEVIANASDLENALSKLVTGSSISVGLARDDKTISVEGTL
jgi:glutaredoxin 3